MTSFSGFGLKAAAKQALIYAIGVWVLRASGFLLVPLYTRRIDPAHFGIYELLSRTFDILCVVLPAGMGIALMRFYGLAEERDRRPVASTAILCPASIGAIATVVLWVLREPVASLILRDKAYSSLIIVLGLWVWFELMFGISCALLRARGQAGLFTAANVGRSLLTIALCFYLVWWRDLGVAGIMVANAVGSGASACLLTVYALASVGLRFSAAYLRSYFAFGLPLVATAVLSASAGTVDRYILNAHMGPAQVGILGLAGRLAMVLGLMTAPIGLAYTPFIFSTAKRPDAPRVFARTMTWIAALTGSGGLALALFAPEAVAVLAPASYQEAVRVARIYLIGACLYGISPLLEIGIYLNGATAWKIPAFLALAGVSFGLNVLLIPWYGPVGAAIAYVAAQSVYVAVLYAIGQRLYRIPQERRRLAKMAWPWRGPAAQESCQACAVPRLRHARLYCFWSRLGCGCCGFLRPTR